jgi:DNA-binding XRE family transcriptional regulator
MANSKLYGAIYAAGFTQKSFAEKINVHKNTINSIITSDKNTNVTIALKIARGLDLTVEELFGGK